MGIRSRGGLVAAVVTVALGLAGCASNGASPAPTGAVGAASTPSAVSSVSGASSGATSPTPSHHASSGASHASAPLTASSAPSAPGGGMDPLTACLKGRPDPAPVAGSTLPRATADDVQCLVDPLASIKASDTTAAVTFSRMADPSTASRGLRSGFLSPFTPDLASFDQTGYGIHGDTKPYMLLAIATPRKVDGISAKYPDFIHGLLAGDTDLYTPAASGVHGLNYGLVIECAHDPIYHRTDCAWMGTSADGKHTPFIGELVILSVVPVDKAETVAEVTFASIAP